MQVTVRFDRSIQRDAEFFAVFRQLILEYGPDTAWVGQYLGANIAHLSWDRAFTLAAKLAILVRNKGTDAVNTIQITVQNDEKVRNWEDTETSLRKLKERREAEGQSGGC